MRIPTSVGYALSAAAAITLLAGCSGGSSQVSPLGNGTSGQSVARQAVGGSKIKSYSVLKNLPAGQSHQTKSWMKQPNVLTRLAYMSDYYANNVTVYGRNAAIQGQIGGLSNPQGLFIDQARNLWVANTGASNVEVFARGSTSPSTTLNDPAGYPVDVTVCSNGTVYVSNIFDFSTGTGSIQVYASGSTNPTGTLTYPGESENFFLTCDAAGNVFSTISDASGGVVVEYPGGNQSGATQLPIILAFPGGIKPNNAGNLLVDDQSGFNITEYTESGSPTGNSISTGGGDIVDIAATKNSRIVGGADATNLQGHSWTFPGGTTRQIYPDGNSGSSLPIGFGFDPGQNGIGD